MSNDIKMTAQPRTNQGTAESRRLRRDGHLPGVIYSEGNEARMIQLNAHEFGLMLQHHASESLLVDLDVEGQGVVKALLRDVQHAPVTGHPVHVDFFEVSMTKTLRTPVSIELDGDPIGVTQGGGVLDQLLYQVEVECLPSDLMERITIDVSEMDIGARFNVGNLDLDTSKYTVITAEDVAIASVAQARVIEEEEEVEEEVEGEGAEESTEEAAAEEAS